MSDIQIIGFSGFARTGKDTAAEALVEDLGFSHIRVADPIKQSAVILDPIVGFAINDTGVESVRLSRLVSDPMNDSEWNSAKVSPYGEEIRRLLQVLGNEASRGVIDEDIWATVCANRARRLHEKGSPVVVSSVRFPNEADAIRGLGGLIIRLERPGFGPANDHPSEVAMNNYDFDAVILNNSDISTFRSRVITTVNQVLNNLPETQIGVPI